MNRIARSLLLGLALLGIAACATKPVENIQQTAPASSVRGASEMQKAILGALNERGWLVQQTSDAQILAEINVRGRHHAEIAIPYSASQFEIQYRSSRGLDYKSGKIHRNYNKWVNILRDDILRNLQASSLSLN
ncbi:hypothetical protein SBP02_02135 [Pseudomonas benzenivorans]|uniref:Lipoprotein n=1 Tax=Pseudomonas benzenivorans TaxID=556533 RepID=A0ABZ0PWL2_9PSED|nr:hypothetical protein [Pseudomonas benzenivorans]WPC05579.1 hypothetical protein SBP02_02135 [Pseudomonas benzenivorans]